MAQNFQKFPLTFWEENIEFFAVLQEAKMLRILFSTLPFSPILILIILENFQALPLADPNFMILRD